MDINIQLQVTDQELEEFPEEHLINTTNSPGDWCDPHLLAAITRLPGVEFPTLGSRKADTHPAECLSDIWEADTHLPECPENSISSTQVVTHSAQGFSSLIIDPSAPAQLGSPC